MQFNLIDQGDLLYERGAAPGSGILLRVTVWRDRLLLAARRAPLHLIYSILESKRAQQIAAVRGRSGLLSGAAAQT
jgi:hypothetical protein